MFATEPQEVYEALVAELATSVVPTTIMGSTIVGVGIVATTELRSQLFLWLTVAGLLSSLAKVAVIAAHARRKVGRGVTPHETKRIEVAHACTTWSMAATIGVMGACLFRLEDLAAHLIATALLFGYCSGIVSRVSVRPRIAAIALTIAAVPCMTAAVLVNTMPHYVVATIFAAFLLGAMESIRHGYRNTATQIATRMQMSSLARRDPLTNLLNRFGLLQAFDETRKRHPRLALHAFDLDGFKAVNDANGHEGGDEVLKQIAERLRASFTDGEIAARVGGDEFVVIQPDTDDLGSARLAKRIHDLIVSPYTLSNGTTVRIGASLGFTAGSSASTLEGLLRDADRTSYIVKRDGGGYRPHRG